MEIINLANTCFPCGLMQDSYTNYIQHSLMCISKMTFYPLENTNGY